jgi:hypothetical protein
VLALNREGLAWAAGFFDGEGNTSISWSNDPPRPYIKLSVSQITLEPLERFQKAILGHGNIYGPFIRPSSQPIWTWQTTNFEDSQFSFGLLFNWLSSPKKNQALKCFQEHFPYLKTPKGLRTHCRNGHSFEGAYISSDGSRQCRTCSIEKSRRQWKQRKVILHTLGITQPNTRSLTETEVDYVIESVNSFFKEDANVTVEA